MNDDAVRSVWLAVQTSGDASAIGTPMVESVLREEGLANQEERRIRILLAVALIVLCPVLLWAAAHGRTPLVRGAYGLMAVGVSVLVAAEWLWLRWSRQGLPGPADTRFQLRTAVFVLARQADLLKMGLVWCAPIFIGAWMIAVLDRSSAKRDGRCGARCRDWSGVGGGRSGVLREGPGDRRAPIPVGAGAGRSLCDDVVAWREGTQFAKRTRYLTAKAWPAGTGDPSAISNGAIQSLHAKSA